MSKKPLFLWCLYDFANSIVLMAFLFYFSQWLVIDQGKPAWWYNTALIGASILFIITAPFISKKIDALKTKIKGLRFWTLLTFIGHVLISLLIMLSDGMEAWITVLYTLSTYAYLVCFLYFTPMLSDLSTQENRSWKSGLGQSANSIGQVVGILITLPFVSGITLFGDPGRAQALLPATLIFGVLALPMLVFYRETNEAGSHSVSVSTQHNFVSLFKEVFSHKSLALLLVAYFLFSDAMLTFANNFPLYLETVHQVTDTVKSLLTASILILAAVGAVIFGKIGDQKGNLKTLKIILLVWCLIFLAMVFITNFKVLIPVFLFAGIFFGPVWAISRSLVGELAPQHLVASSYSYYVVAERFATFIGPALWSVALITVGEGVRGYQTGLMMLTVLVVASLFVLSRIKKVSPIVSN